jgi:hypothetical protein
MPGSIPAPTPIYHITALSNLDSILLSGGLYSHTDMAAHGLRHSDVSNQEIQGNRAVRRVQCCRQGVLHDYVPFFFCPRPPMLLAIQGSHGYAGKRSMIHLVSTAQEVDASKVDYFFTDGHATMGFTEDCALLAQLGAIDWDVIPLKYWGNTVQDGDRKRRKQAEFLVHRFFPFSLVRRIGVYSQQVRVAVEERLQAHGLRIPVTVEVDWYYS